MCRPILTTVFSLLALNTIVLFDSCLLSTFVCDCVQSIINCLLRSRKEIKIVLATHADGRVWTRRGANVQLGGARGAVRPSRPIAKFATGRAVKNCQKTLPCKRYIDRKSVV